MGGKDVLDRLLDELVDGRPVDWSALERDDTGSEQLREQIPDLRLIARIVALHRAIDDDLPLDAGASLFDPDRTRPGDSLAPDPSPAPVRTWGRYQLHECVGAGTFGAVYRASDPDLGLEVALKILHGGRRGEDLRERLLREGRALVKVRHPHVVRVFGVEAEGDQLGLCMEFVRGDTLDAVVRTTGTLNAREAALVGEDVCNALAAVHRAGILHRDVKARNVIREHGGRIVLMDFGAGETSDAPARSAEGTPLYMAPELLAGAPASECSDVYSAGVLLYHLVTGAYPVTGGSLEELRAAHLMGRKRSLTERRPDLPAGFRAIVEQAIASDAVRRYPTAGALLEALEQFRTSARATPVHRYVLIPLSGILLLGATVTGMGVLTSRHFNYALGIGEFAQEGPGDWLRYGAQSLVAPVTLTVAALVVVTLAMAAARLAGGLFTSARGAGLRLRRFGERVGAALRMHDAGVLSCLVLFLSGVALIATWYSFAPLLQALFSFVPTESAAVLERLSTDHCLDHEHYQLALLAIAALSTAAWVQVGRVARRTQQRLNRAYVAGGMAVVLFAAVSLQFPWRMLNSVWYESVAWQGLTCYVMGQHEGDVLLFCPDAEGFRNHQVKRSEVAVRGPRESIFWQFATSREPLRQCVS